MVAKDWHGTPVKCADVSRTQAHERRTGRFKLATILAALIAPVILLVAHLKLVFLTLLGFLVSAFIFYVALILSIYIFHKPARWAFLGIVVSLILAYLVHWIRCAIRPQHVRAPADVAYIHILVDIPYTLG